MRRPAHLLLAIVALALAGACHAQSLQYRFGEAGSPSLVVPNDASINIDGQITVEAWVRISREADDEFFNFIVSKNVDGTGFGLVAIGLGENKRFEFGANTITGGVARGTSEPPIDEWTHVAGVWDGSTTRLYVNGVLEASAVAPDPPQANALDFRIGSSIFQPEFNWQGRLDEVRLWNVARTAEQIQEAFRSGIAGAAPGLVGNWRFDEGEGTTAVDSSGQGNDGQLSNVTYQQCGSPAATNGTAEACRPVIRTIAGSIDIGDGAPATTAFLRVVGDLALDAGGNLLIADLTEARVRRVDADTGIISTIAGTGEQGTRGDGGPAVSAQLLAPTALALDDQGRLYVADGESIRRIDPADGIIRFFSNLVAQDLLFADGELFAAAGDQLFQLDLVTGASTLIAGTGEPGVDGDGGPALAATLFRPMGMARFGSRLLFGTAATVREVNLDSGMITRLAGDPVEIGFDGDGGQAAAALMFPVLDLLVLGSTLHVLEDREFGIGRQRIRRIDLATGIIDSFIGRSEAERTLFLNSARRMAADEEGLLLDRQLDRVTPGFFKLPLDGNYRQSEVIAIPFLEDTTVPVAGGGGFARSFICSVAAQEAALLDPIDVKLLDRDTLVIADSARIRKLDLITGTISVLAEIASTRMAVNAEGELFAMSFDNTVVQIDPDTGESVRVAGSGDPAPGFSLRPTSGQALEFDLSPISITFDRNGDLLVGDVFGLFRVDLETGLLTMLVGEALDTLSTGSGGLATNATLFGALDVAVAADGDIFIVDVGAGSIRRIDAQTGIIDDVFPEIQLFNTADLEFDSEGALFLSDLDGARLLRIDPDDDAISVVAGTGNAGDDGDGGPAIDAELNDPGGIAIDADGNIYVADTSNFAIRLVGSGASPFAIDLQPDDRFGTATAVSGNQLAIGIPNRVGPNGTGAVAIYNSNGCRLDLETLIEVPDGFFATGMGRAVALRKGRLVVGAAEPDIAAMRGGVLALQAALFERANEGWDFKRRFSPPDRTPMDDFGASVAFDGRTVVVGAPGDSTVAPGAGAVYLFPFIGPFGKGLAKVLPASGEPGQGFGTSVAASDNRLAVGAPGSPFGIAVAGTVSIFDQFRDNLDPAGTLTGNDTPGDGFGTSVALSGTSIAAGAPQSGSGGQTFVFDFDSRNQVGPTLEPPTPVAGGAFGIAVGFDADNVYVGAPGTNITALASGSVYGFDRSTMTLTGRWDAEREQVEFGSSLATGRDRVLIGAPGTRDGGGDAVLVAAADVMFGDDFEP